MKHAEVLTFIANLSQGERANWALAHPNLIRIAFVYLRWRWMDDKTWEHITDTHIPAHVVGVYGDYLPEQDGIAQAEAVNFYLENEYVTDFKWEWQK